MSHQLHLSFLDDFGLQAALEDECANFSKRCTIPVQFKAGDIPRSLPQDITRCCARELPQYRKNMLTQGRFGALSGEQS